MPDTGASSTLIPRSAARARTRSATSGTDVDMSIQRLSSGIAAKTPPEPSSTSSTIAGVGSIVTTTSQSRAACAAEAVGIAPWAAAAPVRAATVSKTLSATPAAARLRLIGPPMLPRPMKATGMSSLSITRG